MGSLPNHGRGGLPHPQQQQPQLPPLGSLGDFSSNGRLTPNSLGGGINMNLMQQQQPGGGSPSSAASAMAASQQAAAAMVAAGRNPLFARDRSKM